MMAMLATGTLSLVFLLIVSLTDAASLNDDFKRPFRSGLAPRQTIVDYEKVMPEVIYSNGDGMYPNELHIKIASPMSEPHDVEFILEMKRTDLLGSNFHHQIFDNAGRAIVTEGMGNCFYQGTVQGYPSWRALMSTCCGYRIEFGDKEDMANYYYVEPLATSGCIQLEEVECHAFYKHSEYAEEERGTCGTNKNRGVSRAQRDVNIDRNLRLRRQTQGDPTLYVEWIIVNDFDQFLVNGADVDMTLLRSIEIANGVDAIYSEEYNIRVVLIEVITWSGGDEIFVSSNPDILLDNFEDYQIDTPHDAAMLLTGSNIDFGVLGIAFIAAVCTDFSVGVTQDGGQSSTFVITIAAHELGHNFNMQHDDGRNCQCNDPTSLCIMSAFLNIPNPTEFSSCSRDDLLDGFNFFGIDSCIMNEPTTTVGQECGNAILEDGEECDCGTVDECTDSCCDAATCMLAPNAVCSSSSPCCTASCQIAEQGVECRAADGDCDIAERCDGTSAQCPMDDVVLDGTPCSMGFCYSGNCPSHDQQCNIAFGSSDGDSLCYDIFNVRGDEVGNCGSTFVNFIPCPSEDVRCGQLQCMDGEFLLEDELDVEVSVFDNGIGGVITCRSFTTQPFQGVQSPGLVRDGTVCGTNRVCLSQECINVADITDVSCPTGTNGQVCSGNGICNNHGVCFCNGGFADSLCEDIDECSMDNNNGGCDQICTNTPGSFFCGCEDGFVLNDDGFTCDFIDSCSVDNGGCDHICDGTIGFFSCSCFDGFILNEDGRTCVDIDECLLDNNVNNGGCDQICNNTPGSFFCSCEDGFMLNDDGFSCNEDGCSVNNGGCEQFCLSSGGDLVACLCEAGYTLNEDGRTCDLVTTSGPTSTMPATTEPATVTTSNMFPTTFDIAVLVEFERQYYSVIEGGYNDSQVCVVQVTGSDPLFGDFEVLIQVVSSKQPLSVFGNFTVTFEAGLDGGAVRCVSLDFPNDNYVNSLVREFELQLIPLQFSSVPPGLSLITVGDNAPAWLFLVEPTIVEIGFTQMEYTVNEIDGEVFVCIELLTPVHLIRPIEVRVETQDGTAIAGQDYEATTRIVLLGVKRPELEDCPTCFEIPVFSDGVEEGDETFIVSITSFDVGVIIDQSIATVTIVDNIDFVVQFNENTPLVDGNTLYLSFFSSVPPTDATCFVERSVEGEQDCTDGSAEFILRDGTRPHNIAVYINFPNGESVHLIDRVRSETTDVCWAHLINEGLTVSTEDDGSTSVTIQFQGTGPAINSPPRIQEFECTLFSVSEDDQMIELFQRPCFAPTEEIANLDPGVYYISIRPVDGNCRRRIQLFEHFIILPL